MLYEEAKWIGRELLKLSKPGYRILNIGSSSHEFRANSQPYINEFIFRPLTENNITVVHTDIVDEKGVDIVGDLTDEIFIEKLKQEKYEVIICSNLLEHMINRDPIISAIKEILATNGFALITVPYKYPYHLDPIDTMFRPTINEIHKNFHEFELKKSEIVIGKSFRKNKFQKNYWQQINQNPKLILKLLLRCLVPFYKPKVWFYTIISMKNIFKPFSATCILVKK